MPIKNLHKIEMPREKLEKYGPEKLSEVELVAIILRTGLKGVGVLELSKQILKVYRENKLADSAFAELKKIKGIGTTKASQIIAAFELGRRFLKGKQSVLILSPKEVWEQCKDIRESKKEHFVVFFLNTQNQQIEREVISVGTLNASLIHPREVFEPAVKNLASHVLIVHNHPSGSLDPSREDLAVTKRLVDSGRLLGVEVIDHVIVTNGGYISFIEKNLL